MEYSVSEPKIVNTVQIRVGKELYNFTIKQISRTEPDWEGMYVSAECEPENKPTQKFFGSKVKLFGRIENGLSSIEYGTITTENDKFFFKSQDADSFRLFLQKADPKAVAVYEDVTQLRNS